MNAQYDEIARRYQRTRSSPLRRWVEMPSLLRLAGEVRGLRVLDLACGDGFYSRQLAAAGAAEVVGVDISPAMLALAREAPPVPGRRIQYLCADVAELPELGQFDLVLAAYLLHYAPDTDTLAAMCSNIHRSLAEHGRLVALTENPAQPAEPAGGYVAYGFSKRCEQPLADGSRIRYQMLAGREVFAFDVHWFRQDTYERCLRDAGFQRLRWGRPAADPAGIALLGEAYFDRYLAHPPVLTLECWR